LQEKPQAMSDVNTCSADTRKVALKAVFRKKEKQNRAVPQGTLVFQETFERMQRAPKAIFKWQKPRDMPASE
jgi:ribosomal protein L39E